MKHKKEILKGLDELYGMFILDEVPKREIRLKIVHIRGLVDKLTNI